MGFVGVPWVSVDPTLIRDPNLAGVVVFFVLLAVAVIGALLFNRSPDGDWLDERHGHGSVVDDWGLPRR